MGARFAILSTGALLAILVSVASVAEARGGRGGGFGGGGIRGGGMSSMSRGSDFGRGSYDRGSGSYRSGGTFSRDGSYSKPSRLDNKPSRLEGGSGSRTNWDSMTRTAPGRGSASQLPAERPASGGGSAAQLPASRPGSGYATQLPSQRPIGDGGGAQLPARPPGGNISRPDCPKCSDGWDPWIDHPIAAGIAIGAIAGARAAAIGMTYYSLPYDCPPYYWDNVYYYACDGYFYQPQYEGDTIVYVTVPDPSDGKQKPAK